MRACRTARCLAPSSRRWLPWHPRDPANASAARVHVLLLQRRGVRHGAAAPAATARSGSTSRRVLGVLSISRAAMLTSRILDLLIDQPCGYHHRDHGSQGAGRAARWPQQAGAPPDACSSPAWRPSGASVASYACDCGRGSQDRSRLPLQVAQRCKRQRQRPPPGRAATPPPPPPSPAPAPWSA